MEIEMQILSNLSTHIFLHIITKKKKKKTIYLPFNPQTFIYKSYVGKFGELYG